MNEVVESEEEDKPVVIEDNTSSQSVAKRRITSITDIFSEPKKSKVKHRVYYLMYSLLLLA